MSQSVRIWVGLIVIAAFALLFATRKPDTAAARKLCQQDWDRATRAAINCERLGVDPPLDQR